MIQLKNITRFKEIKAQVIHRLTCKEINHWTDRIIFGGCKCDNQETPDEVINSEVEQMQLMDDGSKKHYEDNAKFYERN